MWKRVFQENITFFFQTNTYNQQLRIISEDQNSLSSSVWFWYTLIIQISGLHVKNSENNFRQLK